MNRLKHLFLNRIEVTRKCGDKLFLDGLDELETLQEESYNDSCVCVTDIPKLKNLRNLKIHICGNDALSIIVGHMTNDNMILRNAQLKIRGCSFSLAEAEKSNNENLCKILMSASLTSLDLLGNINFQLYKQGMCKNLVDFKLFCGGTIEREDDEIMKILGQFPTLKKLALSFIVFPKGKMRCLKNSFLQLKDLILEGLNNLERWVVDKGAMPNLSFLSINTSAKLEMIPDGLRFITTLQRLVTMMPKEFNDRLQEVVNGQPGQDYHKISHIPSISLVDLEEFDQDIPDPEELSEDSE